MRKCDFGEFRFEKVAYLFILGILGLFYCDLAFCDDTQANADFQHYERYVRNLKIFHKFLSYEGYVLYIFM